MLTPPPAAPDVQGSLLRLNQIVKELRLNCPWDREQTIESLRHLTVEEVYELSDAILAQDHPELQKELGDLLLHVFFYANLAEEAGLFDLKALTDAVCEKLIRRHPHVYGEGVATNSDQVKQTWEQVKLKEGSRSVLKGVPQSMPALVKAYRIQEKAAGVGFDWPTTEGVWDKVHEELRELQQAANPAERSEELGDLLFVLVNLARKMGLNPDDALEQANRKFIRRFQAVEAKAEAQGTTMASLNLDALDALWNEVKLAERNPTP
jgi:XTP/dITP diphosphohydrolase